MSSTESQERTNATTQPGRPEDRAPGVSSPPPSNGTGSRRRHILAGVVILAVAAACIAAYWYFFMRGRVFTDDARLAGQLVDLAPTTAGRLAAVLVREGQSVRAGEVLFRQTTDTQEAAVSQAAGALASARASLAASQAQYERALNGNRPEEIKAAEATAGRLQNEEELAQLELTRVLELRQKDAVAQDRLDRARSAYESARQSHEAAAQTLALLRQGARQEDIEAAKAGVELARSRVTEAAAALDKANIDVGVRCVPAPFDGWVVRRWLDPGAMLQPGQPVVSLFDPATLRVDANIEERFLNRIAIGDTADIRVDAYPRLRLTGRVAEILRATNSKFSLIPAEGVSGTFIKVSQRVPLRITVTAPRDLPLGPGLSVEVRVRVGSGTRVRANIEH